MALWEHLSRDVPEDLVAQYPDLSMDPVEHGRLVAAKYAGTYGYAVPDRLEHLRTEEWGEVDLGDVLACETFLEARDAAKLKTLSVSTYSGHLITKNNLHPFPGWRWQPSVSPEGWHRDGGVTDSSGRLYMSLVFDIPRDVPVDLVYTVEWRSGAVTLMPLDLVKVHRYEKLPEVPAWLNPCRGRVVLRKHRYEVPESAVVERWHLTRGTPSDTDYLSP